MTASGRRLMRLALLAYPPSFRRHYGDEMLRCVHDLRRHGDTGRARLALHVAADVLLTAPRMRMETMMTRTIAVTFAAGATLMLGLVVSPLALIAIPALVILAVLVRGHDTTIAPDDQPRARWRGHLLRGLALLGVAGAILVIDGGELSEPVWAIWALSFLAGMSLVILGVVLRFSPHADRGMA